MNDLAFALMMKRLTVWLDQAWQPAGFVSKQYDGAPFGRCYLSIDPNRQSQYASANSNRVHLCGAEPGLRPEGLARMIEQYTAADVERFFVWLSPGPDMDTVRGWLVQAGFAPRMQWVRYPTLVRETVEPPPFRSDLVVREARGNELAAAHAAVGDTMWGEYERSFGKDGFTHFMAFDGARPVAIAALAVFEGLGYLTLATTADKDRKRGAQSALIAARIAKARALGCTAVATETLTMLEHSLRNLERAGFRVAYEKEVYAWGAPPASSS
jgi:GNAT superfamily N-acetyltransferase